jgi:hypothetical protein
MAMIGKVKRMHFREKKSVREIVRLTSLSRVNAGQEPPLFDGEVAVLMHGWFSRTAPAGLSWC